MIRPLLLWVTRSSPFNILTAQRLRAMGHAVLTVPLFDIRALPAVHDYERPDLIAFTSVNGVRHHTRRPEWEHVPVFTVGDATAAAAQRSGYRDVRSAGGNLQDLQALILRSVATGTRVLHFSASEPAGDLAAFLRCRGFLAERRSVYEAVPRPFGDMHRLLAGNSPVDGIVVHSPRGGGRAAEIAADTGWSGRVFCLSDACAREFRQIPAITVRCASRPSERSLMKIIRDVTASSTTDAMALSSGSRMIVRGAITQSAPEIANDNGAPEPTPA